MSRHYTLIDQLLIEADHALSALYGDPSTCKTHNQRGCETHQTEAGVCSPYSADIHTATSTQRGYPAAHITEPLLSDQEKKLSARLTRVNHAGELCAQALWRGKALTTKSPGLKPMLYQAASEEADHLAWCQQRLKELHSHSSYLGCFWYVSSLLMGMLVGRLGSSKTLGFIEETERQVTEHLDKYLEKLPERDLKTRAIFAKMREEELQHAQTAHQQGAEPMPKWGSRLMKTFAKVMIILSYRL